jgi:LysM repeat protein
MPGKRNTAILYISLVFLLLSAFAPRFAIALPEARTLDQGHDSGYIDWNGNVGYTDLFHRDFSCGPAYECTENVTRISNGGAVSGSLAGNVDYFEVMLARSGGGGFGTATITACSSSASYYLGTGGSVPGFNSFPHYVPPGCTSWSVTASGGDVYFRSVDANYSVVIQPPVITGTLNCAQPGNTPWCIGALTLDLTASEPQGKTIDINGDVDGNPFYCPPKATTCSVAMTTEGTHTANFKVDSATGLSANGSVTYYLDYTTPALSINPNIAPDANGWFTSPVTLTASATDTTSGPGSIESSIDGGAWATYPPTASITLSDGRHNLQFRAIDKAGNTSPVKNVDVNVDTISPVVDLLYGAPTASGWYLSKPTVSAHASDSTSGIAAFEVMIDRGTWTTYDNDTPLTLDDGIHTVQFRATDHVGHLTTSDEIIFQVDSTSPSLTTSISNGVNPSGWYTFKPQVSAHAEDPISDIASFEVTVDHGAWTPYPDRNPIIINDGIHTVQFRATDVAGNLTTSDEMNIKVDTIKPLIKILPPIGKLGNGWYLSATEVSVEVTDPPSPAGTAGSGLASVEASQNGAAYTAYTKPLLFADGKNTYKFKATDVAGNVTETLPQNLLVDTVPPIIGMDDDTLSLGETLYSVLEDYGSGLYTYRAVIEDEDERYQKIVWFDQVSGTKLEDEILWDGKFADGTKAAPGDYYITLKISDAAGNETWKTATVNVDLINSLLPHPPFTPPASTTLTPNPPPLEEGALSFGGTANEETGETSTTSTSYGGAENNLKEEEPSLVKSTAGGTVVQGEPHGEPPTWSVSPVTNTPSPLSTPGVLWGAAAAAAIGYFISEAEKQREEEEQKRREEAEAQQQALAQMFLDDKKPEPDDTEEYVSDGSSGSYYYPDYTNVDSLNVPVLSDLGATLPTTGGGGGHPVYTYATIPLSDMMDACPKLRLAVQAANLAIQVANAANTAYSNARNAADQAWRDVTQAENMAKQYAARTLELGRLAADAAKDAIKYSIDQGIAWAKLVTSKAELLAAKAAENTTYWAYDKVKNLPWWVPFRTQIRDAAWWAYDKARKAREALERQVQTQQREYDQALAMAAAARRAAADLTTSAAKAAADAVYWGGAAVIRRTKAAGLEALAFAAKGAVYVAENAKELAERVVDSQRVDCQKTIANQRQLESLANQLAALTGISADRWLSLPNALLGLFDRATNLQNLINTINFFKDHPLTAWATALGTAIAAALGIHTAVCGLSSTMSLLHLAGFISLPLTGALTTTKKQRVYGILVGMLMLGIILSACAGGPSGSPVSIPTGNALCPAAPTTTPPVPTQTMTPPPPTATATPAPIELDYTVQPGEYISNIASSYGITQQELCIYNGWAADCSYVQPGQILKIPPADLSAVNSPGIASTLNYTIPPDPDYPDAYLAKVNAQAFLRAITDPDGTYKNAWWFANDGKVTSDEMLAIVLYTEGSIDPRVQQAIAARYLEYCGGDHDGCSNDALLNVLSYYQPVLHHNFPYLVDTANPAAANFVSYADQILNQTALGLDWAQTYVHHNNGLYESQWDNIPMYYANVDPSWMGCLRMILEREPDNTEGRLWILTPQEAEKLSGDRYKTPNLTLPTTSCQ